MEVIINGDAIDIKGEFSNIREIIAKLFEIVRSNKKTITSISIDDQPIDHNDEQSLNKPYEGQNICIITEETDKVLERSINESIDYMESSLLENIMEISMGFREGEISKASQQVSVITETFYWLLDLVDFMAKHGVFNDAEMDLNDFQISDFTSFLKEIMDAQEVKDYVLVADLLEYEIHPLIENWLELFKHIKEIV